MTERQELSPRLKGRIKSYNSIFRILGLGAKHQRVLESHLDQRVLAVTVPNSPEGIAKRTARYQAAIESPRPLTVVKSNLATGIGGDVLFLALVKLGVDESQPSFVPGSLVSVGSVSARDSAHPMDYSEFTAQDLQLVLAAEASLAESGAMTEISSGRYHQLM